MAADYNTGLDRVYVDAPLDAPLRTGAGTGVEDYLGQNWQAFCNDDVSVFARPTMHAWLDDHPDNIGTDSDPHRYAQEMVLDFLSGGKDYLDGVVMLTDRGEESAGMLDEYDYARAHIPSRHYPYFSTTNEELSVHDDVAELNEVLDEFVADDDSDAWTRLYFAGPVSIDPATAKANKRDFLQEHYETLRDRKINVHSPHMTYTWIDKVDEHAGKGSPPEDYVMSMCLDFVGPAYNGVDRVVHLTAPDQETPRMRAITVAAEEQGIPVDHHPLFTRDGTPLPDSISAAFQE